ncbi:hypothetical protein VKT23_009641 [Stygiomarasmius scandens]|uniref:Uncharacterized protein n=1 Tax=Marasmiellus scandens TaxID=2682957 RepID=A0ABR1JH15_9AGAR
MSPESQSEEKAIGSTVSNEQPSWNDDQDVLAHLGYKEEFKRDFSRWELFGLSFSIVGVVQSIAAIVFYSIWWTRRDDMGSMAMAELGSSAPTAGGLYYWTFQFSSKRYRRLLSWLIGYINTAAYCAGLASVDWGCATQIMAVATIHSNGAFVPTNAQTYGVYCALLLSHAVMASLATKIIARLQYLYVFLNLALFFAVVIALPVSSPTQLVNKASYAFGHFENGSYSQNFILNTYISLTHLSVSGWTDGYAFILSFLAPAWTVGSCLA